MDGLQSNYSCWIYHDNTTKWNHTVQNGASEHKDHIGMPSILARLINGILLLKLFWPAVRKNCSSDREKLLKFEAEGWESAKILRSLEQFVQTVQWTVTECFFNLFLRFLRSNKLEQLEFELEKIIGI